MRDWQKESNLVLDFPKVVLLDTINACNLRCSMCGRQKMTRKSGIMDFNLYKKIIDEISEKDKNTRVWEIFFGDPFMLKDRFFDYVRYAKEKGLNDVVTNTNGNLLNESFAIKLIESGLDAIYFGVDASTSDVYEKLRVGGNLEKVKNNIFMLLKLKEKYKSDKPKIYVQFVCMPENQHQKEDFIKYWNSYGITVKIRDKVSWAGTVEAKNLDPQKERYPCYWLMRSVNILYDGKVVLCAVDYDGKCILGDVNVDSIENIWKKNIRAIQNLHLNKEWQKLPEFCYRCLDWQSGGRDYYIG